MINTIINGTDFQPKTLKCDAFSNGYVVTNDTVSKCWFGAQIKDYQEKHSNKDTLDKKWIGKSIYSNQKCSKCKYRFLCGGGCLARIYKSNKDILKLRNCVDFGTLLNTALIYSSEET